MNGTLKIKRTYTGFSGRITTGQFSLFIVLDDYGSEISTDQLVLTCVNYNNVVIKSVKGEEVFEQCADLSKLIKSALKKHTDLTFEIHTLGLKKPTGITKIDRVRFIVNIELKNSGKDYKKRVVGKALNWFNETGSNFVFYISNKDDFDEVNLIINDFGIPKSKIYLMPFTLDGDCLELVKEIAKTTGYNVTLDFDKILWN